MHLHIIGICGTFMGGVALLARAAGHRVTGCDANVYPPMSEVLAEQAIDVIEGFNPIQLDLKPDIFVIGNALSRGNPLIEAILEAGAAYTSGPQWLAENVLQNRWVLAVAGTHGKTTTSAMLAWILEYAGMQPGFLIGGVPLNFGLSARLGESTFFVIEADEYDTAFFDKRSKFVHYRPRTAVLNNLEFDHADIFTDLAAIETQFHHLVRTVPASGRLIINGSEPSLDRVLTRGCWSEQERFTGTGQWKVGAVPHENSFEVLLHDQRQGFVNSDLTGAHNRANALAAIAAAHHVGVSPATSIEAMGSFKNVKRRMEVRGVISGITVYDDFAHHPTAIAATIEGLRHKVGKNRIIAVLEPRSNTMKLGAIKAALPNSLTQADLVFGYGATQGKHALGWDLAAALAPLALSGKAVQTFNELSTLVQKVAQTARAGDHILIMSNGDFGGVHEKLLTVLKATYQSAP
jgi:UDP-N-acetylmuramate: L-alanyl-gamma-D-glutamyl-meso-diaminopimelate ligase